jgi:hypothetical protein
MAILTAFHAVNTRDLPEIAEIGNGDEYYGTSNANNPGVVGGVSYFGSSSPHYLGLHIKLISLVGDLEIAGGNILVSMTINDIEVYASNNPSPNDPMYEIRGISVQMTTDLFADAGDNGKLDTLPAKIFSGDDTLNGSALDDILSHSPARTSSTATTATTRWTAAPETTGWTVGPATTRSMAATATM